MQNDIIEKTAYKDVYAKIVADDVVTLQEFDELLHAINGDSAMTVASVDDFLQTHGGKSICKKIKADDLFYSYEEKIIDVRKTYAVDFVGFMFWLRFGLVDMSDEGVFSYGVMKASKFEKYFKPD